MLTPGPKKPTFPNPTTQRLGHRENRPSDSVVCGEKLAKKPTNYRPPVSQTTQEKIPWEGEFTIRSDP